MKLDVYVSAMVDMKHMIINVPKNPTNVDIVNAVLYKIQNGGFCTSDTPELRYIEDNKTTDIYYDY